MSVLLDSAYQQAVGPRCLGDTDWGIWPGVSTADEARAETPQGVPWSPPSRGINEGLGQAVRTLADTEGGRSAFSDEAAS